MLGAEAQKLFDHMPDATLLVDRQGVIRGANPATERVFGYTPSALVGERLERLIPEGARSHHQRTKPRRDCH